MSLRETIGKKKLLSVEYNPPKGASNPNLEKLKEVSQFIDFINITDCPMASIRLNVITASYLVRQHLQKEVVFNLTCRDRNRLAITSDLLGANALGLENVLAINGDPIFYKPEENVYKFNTYGLLSLIDNLNKGVDFCGNQLKSKTNFFCGVASNIPTKLSLKGIRNRLKRKHEHSAKFVITQPIYSIESLELFLEAIDGINMFKIIGIFPPPSLKVAVYLHKNVKGITIPENYLKRLQDANNEKEQTKKLSLELIEKITTKGYLKLIDGIHLMRFDQELLQNVYQLIRG
ncbi:methylenetetrahydrofolate reductase [Hippea jasoniae]|uniref:methylenetetrahydrofolate reductase n=1 Tax=Hippea jasoniae TaxID=944479 RepID=UPI0005561973|nr:methylenetetrahydrofolate reductase [Hippea jasoniae]